MSDRNLFDETVSTLKTYGYERSDVAFISLDGIEIEPGEFWEFAARFWYDNGYGLAEIPPFILSMSDGTWYERAEYDGSEWWRHVVPPTCPNTVASLARVLDGDYMYRRAALEAENMVCEAAAMLEYERDWEEAERQEAMDALCDELEAELDRRRPGKPWWSERESRRYRITEVRTWKAYRDKQYRA